MTREYKVRAFTDRQMKDVVARLRGRFLEAKDGLSAVQYYQALNWYEDAYDWIHDLAKKTGMQGYQVAAVVALLSPRTNWDINKKQAEVVCYAYHEWKTQGRGGQYEVPPVNTKQRRKAVERLLRTQSGIYDVSNGQKVISFYHNLMLQDTYHTTIDVWAWKSATGTPSPMYEDGRDRHISKVEYSQLIKAFAIATESLKVEGYSDLTPQKLQAILWVWERLRTQIPASREV